MSHKRFVDSVDPYEYRDRTSEGCQTVLSCIKDKHTHNEKGVFVRGIVVNISISLYSVTICMSSISVCATVAAFYQPELSLVTVCTFSFLRFVNGISQESHCYCFVLD